MLRRAILHHRPLAAAAKKCRKNSEVFSATPSAFLIVMKAPSAINRQCHQPGLPDGLFSDQKSKFV
jgi:hypothetical protein